MESMVWSASRSRAAVEAFTAGVVAAVLFATPVANASATYESRYGYERTWNAAVRLVRVDNGWKVTEKDDVNGYLLFEYQSSDSPKGTPGSFELARGTDASEPVRVVVRLPQMPRYHEQVLVDALAGKMRREYGPPPERPRVPVADGGADAAED
jgi:hypothetical protein